MNKTREEMQRDESQWFDLLVDGELDGERRRELLSRLDDHPEGWRRCALAFLEAQSWGRELGDVVADANAQTSPMPAATAEVRSRTWGLGSWLAVAASFIAAFGLGLFLRDFGMPRGGQSAAPLVAARQGAPHAQDALAIRDAQQLPALGMNDLAQQDYIRQSSPGGGIMTMSFRPDPDGQLQEIQVPFVDDPAISPEWLTTSSPAMPQEILRDLQRSGHLIEQSRQLVPFDLQDGRRVVVPVDHVNIHYVGNRSYQ